MPLTHLTIRMLAIALFFASLSHVFALPAFRLPALSPSSPSLCKTNGMEGWQTPTGACRYTLKYGQVSERWAYSTISRDLSSAKTMELPPACSQIAGTYVQGSIAEDCLYAVLYAPRDILPSSNLPVFVWVHGGSFVQGGASAPGLDASAMASKGLIVIVLQYRLGVLGFLPPSLAESFSDPNLGLLDLINGLKVVKDNVRSFGGDPGRVTVGGQSSGSGMIRSLLGASSAVGLFQAAILQSDPMSYGLSSTITTGQLRDAFYSSDEFGGCTDLECLQAVPILGILNAQRDLLSYAPYTFDSVPLAEVIRPTYGTNTLPHDPTSFLFTNPHSLPISPSSVSLMITTTRNEGGSAVQQLFPVPIPVSNATFKQAMIAFTGQQRADLLFEVPQYGLKPKEEDTFRKSFERMVTDGIWRCPNRAVASAWANFGGKVWVGEWEKGISYPTNEGSYCRTGGRVCHEDDIYPTFGSGSSSAGSSQDEVLDRWVSFISHGDPNPSSSGDAHDYFRRVTQYLKERANHLREKAQSWWKGLIRDQQHPQKRAPATWSRYTGDEEQVYGIGGGTVLQCPAVGWGETIKYDWQLYP